MKKRLLAVLMTVAMIIVLVPAVVWTVSAADTTISMVDLYKSHPEYFSGGWREEDGNMFMAQYATLTIPFNGTGIELEAFNWAFWDNFFHFEYSLTGNGVNIKDETVGHMGQPWWWSDDLTEDGLGLAEPFPVDPEDYFIGFSKTGLASGQYALVLDQRHDNRLGHDWWVESCLSKITVYGGTIGGGEQTIDSSYSWDYQWASNRGEDYTDIDFNVNALQLAALFPPSGSGDQNNPNNFINKNGAVKVGPWDKKDWGFACSVTAAVEPNTDYVWGAWVRGGDVLLQASDWGAVDTVKEVITKNGEWVYAELAFNSGDASSLYLVLRKPLMYPHLFDGTEEGGPWLRDGEKSDVTYLYGFTLTKAGGSAPDNSGGAEEPATSGSSSGGSQTPPTTGDGMTMMIVLFALSGAALTVLVSRKKSRG